MSSQTSDHGDREVYRLAIPGTERPYISYGLPFPETCTKHLSETFHASRAYIICSRSLATQTSALKRLQDALGDSVVGVTRGMTPHTLWSECLQVTEDVRRTGADIIITLGAGSLTDAAKIIALALANNATTFAHLDHLQSGDDWTRPRPDVRPPTLPIISIPTSLSGGEYQDLAGGTNDATRQKHGFGVPTRGPLLVVLDAALSATTPDSVWLSTGVRAVDHCVETLCSLEAGAENVEGAAERGLRQLAGGLLRCRGDRGDLEARHRCQMGVVGAMEAVKRGVPMGASHGIGHQLGPLGVGHGETSCVLLPAVCKYNKGVNGERQERVKGVLWEVPEVREVLERRGVGEEKADLGDVLDAVVRELGMPRTLKDVGVGRDRFEELAENSLRDKWCGTNPIPLTRKEQVLEILELVAE